MLLTIGIISLIAMILNVIKHIMNDKIDINILWSAIVVLAWWNICLPFAIIVIVVTVIIGIIGAIANPK